MRGFGQGLGLLGVLWLAGCVLDFNESIPCDDDAQCIEGFRCELALGQCVEDPDASVALNNRDRKSVV